MRITSAWTRLILENTGLKSALICLTLICFALSALLFEASSKEPLIIERTCFSRAIEITGSLQTKEEVDTFVRLALSQRFDSEAKTVDLMDLELRQLRSKEQNELSARQMSQFIHVTSITGENGAYAVDADRLISVGSVRSALRFPLSIKIAAIPRSTANPYGLTLVDVTQIKEVKNEK